MAGRPVAAAPCHQGSQQHHRIQPVGFGTPSPAVHLQATRIHHPAGDPLRGDATMQPKAVIASLIAENDLHLLSGRSLLTCRQAPKQGEQPADIAAIEPVRGCLATRRRLRGQYPGALAEFHRHEYRSTRPRCFGINVTHRPAPCRTGESQAWPNPIWPAWYLWPFPGDEAAERVSG